MIVHFPKFHEVSVFIIHTKTFLLIPESDYEIYVRPQVKPKKKELERVGRSNNIGAFWSHTTASAMFQTFYTLYPPFVPVRE